MTASDNPDSGVTKDESGTESGENNVIGCKPIRNNNPFNQSKGAAYTKGKGSLRFGGIPLFHRIPKRRPAPFEERRRNPMSGAVHLYLESIWGWH